LFRRLLIDRHPREEEERSRRGQTAPSANQFTRTLRRGRTPAVGVEVAGASASARSTRVINSVDGAAGCSCFNSASRSENSFIRRGRDFFSRPRARSDNATRRCFERCRDFGDLGEREFVPDFHHQDLPLFFRQLIDGDAERLLGFTGEIELRRGALIRVGDGIGFTARTASIAAQEIERDGADGSEEERAVLDGMLLAPEADKRFLHDVLGIRGGADKLAREEDQPGRGFGEASFPIFMSADILHDLFTVFAIETPPIASFV
jgi:hypothetical protein